MAHSSHKICRHSKVVWGLSIASWFAAASSAARGGRKSYSKRVKSKLPKGSKRQRFSSPEALIDLGFYIDHAIGLLPDDDELRRVKQRISEWRMHLVGWEWSFRAETEMFGKDCAWRVSSWEWMKRSCVRNWQEEGCPKVNCQLSSGSHCDPE